MFSLRLFEFARLFLLCLGIFFQELDDPRFDVWFLLNCLSVLRSLAWSFELLLDKLFSVSSIIFHFQGFLISYSLISVSSLSLLLL